MLPPGLSLAAAWLCHEDNALLLPFVLCAAAVYLAYLFLDKSIAHKKSRLALLLVPLALWGGGIAAWCRHELQVLWPFYHQRFHFQRIQ